MVFDQIARAQRYYALHPLFQTAFEFLHTLDLAAIDQAAYEIRPNKQLRAFIGSEPMRSAEAAKLEAHRHYIDIQIPLGGSDLHRCLLSAVRQFEGQPLRRRLVIYVGDAEPGEFRDNWKLLSEWEQFPELVRKAGISLTSVLVRRSAEGLQHWRTLMRDVGAQAFELQTHHHGVGLGCANQSGFSTCRSTARCRTTCSIPAPAGRARRSTCWGAAAARSLRCG